MWRGVFCVQLHMAYFLMPSHKINSNTCTHICGVGAILKVVWQNFTVSSWQVLWTELEISTIFESNSVLKAAHAGRSGACPPRKTLNFSSSEVAF